MSHESLFIGFVVSMLFYEWTGVYPGGIVVPAFLALYLTEPFRLLGTLAIVLLSLVVYRLLSFRLILFGRRRFFVLMMTAGLLTMACGILFPSLLSTASDFRAIGVVVPGLFANTCQRQGIVVTIASACVAMTVTYLLSRLLLVF